MATPRWVLAPQITTGFALAFALFVAASAGGLYEPIVLEDEPSVSAEVSPALRALHDAVRRRRVWTIAAIGTTTLLGTTLLALSLAALNRQTSARMTAERERERLVRVEAAKAEEARTLEERARSEEALRLSSEQVFHASERARAEAERAQRLVDSNIVGVFFTRDDTVTQANDAYLDLLGYTREDLVSGRMSFPRASRDVVTALTSVTAPTSVAAPSSGSGPTQRELVRKDGTRVPVLLGTAKLDGGRESVCFVVDQTERERTLAALRAAQEQAEAANLAKDQFLAVLSHELRSPLHAMLGWLSILKKNLAAGRNVDRAVEILERNVGLQARMVDDLLDVSRIVSNKLAIEEEPVDLGMIVEAMVESVRPAAEARNLTLSCSVAKAAPPAIGDEKRLRQMVGNLVNNAVKFTSAGGRVDVALRVDPRAETATIEVRDDGMGIPPEFLPHLFERFRLADASNTRSHGGLGLGLCLVKTLTELHGGRIEASSEGVGKGATFLVHLPLRPSPLGAAPAAAHAATGDLAGVTVVLLEDEADGREAICLALEQSGAQVHAVSSAAEARRTLERVVPDVIISDIGMPGENGYAFLRAVRSGGAPHVLAIAISGFASKQDREEAAMAGFDDHLAKPVNADALIARLCDLLRRRSGSRFRVSTPSLSPAQDA
jgi:PAS domain S-box-containing protein